MRRSRFAVPGMALALALGGGLGGTALAPPVAATPAVAAHRSLPASIVAEQAGDDAIAQHYEQLGGSASFLGAAIGGTYDIAGGRAQDYTAGTIYWSPATGAHEVHGAIRGRYLAFGGPGGYLGFPLTDETASPGGSGQYNDFERGTVYWSPGTGAHEVHGAIRGEYLAFGGPGGYLGFPLIDETATPGGGGQYNDFERGTVYWSPGTGAREVHGAIRGEYLAFGGPGGYLGFPLIDETATPGGGGQYNDFERGTVYWSPGTGAHEVHGAIRGRYFELGGPSGVLGFPVTDETGTSDGVGRYNHFSGTNAGSSIFWSPAAGAHEVYGAIRAQWAVLGWERSRLGYPTSGEYGITGGRRNDFQQGSILWHAASGRTEVVYTSFPSALRGVDLERIPTTQRIAALTFDAGANDAALRSILATLAANGVPGTFFLTGDWVNQFPSDPALIYNAGHRIGNHSMTHPDFTTLNDAQIAAEINSAQGTIEAAGGDPLPFFRFPYGARDGRTITDVNAAGYAAIRWTVDTLGWQGTMNGTRGPDFVVQRVMASAQPGEIILMHLGSNPDDGSTLDAAALPQVISQLRAAGYGFVTLDAALG
ncbi:polysaccharide deacetylase family protein [Arthrobacter sp. FW306-06-A]|uniref:polysaccharide deacetylase family protein n=1 Tax=Arthrobacter sp. FW306-06-A TaxID=2879621 RepID=UPI001EFFC7F1|nr:polysaccharide deacetylase family protein [Arthrobacter sp. FW306-06-A]UKA72721.1 polysaccharide deacetylase family protein [Arthrobacter sp. FW306-06-A]